MHITSLIAAALGVAMALPATVLAEGSSYGQPDPAQGKTQSQDQGKSQGQGKSKEQAQAPVILIVPVTTATDEAMAKGCWARLYDTTDFGGNMLTLSGKVEIAAMRSGRIAGFEWDRNFDSVVVGPGATLMTWQDDDYGGETRTFKANQRVRDLDSKMGYFEDINSLKLNCTPRQK